MENPQKHTHGDLMNRIAILKSIAAIMVGTAVTFAGGALVAYQYEHSGGLLLLWLFILVMAIMLYTTAMTTISCWGKTLKPFRDAHWWHHLAEVMAFAGVLAGTFIM